MAQSELSILIKAKDEASKVFDDVSGKASGLGGALGGVAKIAGGIAVAGIAVAGTAAVGLGVALSGAVREAMAAQEVQAQLNAVLQSTGGVAGVTAQAANDLATALSQVTRYDDEAILSAEALMLTFTNINSNVFPEATQLALDMSTAMGQDLNTSVLQLGKALNDPLVGMTALQRVGVAFTEDQKEQIKALTESGDLMGAQKIILAELAKEFGGSAVAAGQTFAGQMDILNNTVGNLKETVGTALLPALTDLGGKLTETLNKPEVQAAITKLAEKLADLAETALPVLIDFLTGPAMDAFIALMNVLSGEGGGGGISKAFADVAAFVKPVTDALGPLVTAMTDLWNVVSPLLIPVLQRMAAILTGVIVPLFGNQVLNAVKTLIGVFAGFITVVTGVINAIVGLLTGDKAKIDQGTQQIADGIIAIFEALLEGVKTTFGNIVQAVIDAFTQLGIDIVTPVQEVWTAVSDEISTWPDKMVEFGKSLMDGLISGIKGAGQAVVDAASGVLTDVWNAITGQEEVESPSKHWAWLGQQLGLGLAQGIRAVTGTVSTSAKELVQTTFRTWYDALKDHFGGGASNIRRMFQTFMRDWLATATVGVGETTAQLVERMLADVARVGGPAMQRIVAQFGQQFKDLLGAAGGLPGTGTMYSVIDALLSGAGALGSIGGAAASRYESRVLAPLREQLRLLEEQGGSLMEIARLKSEIADGEQRIAEFQKQQQDLQWLGAQLDLIKLIKDNGLDAGALLGDLTFGLGADPAAFMEAMTGALRQMAQQVQTGMSGLGVSVTGQPLAPAYAGMGGSGMPPVMINYQPVFSAVDKREAELKLRPLIEDVIRKVVRGL